MLRTPSKNIPCRDNKTGLPNKVYQGKQLQNQWLKWLATWFQLDPTADLLQICQLQRVEAPPHQSTALRIPASARSAPPGFDSHHLQFCRQLPASRSPTLARLAPAAAAVPAARRRGRGAAGASRRHFCAMGCSISTPGCGARRKAGEARSSSRGRYGGGGPCGGALFFPLPLSQVFIRPVSSS